MIENDKDDIQDNESGLHESKYDVYFDLQQAYVEMSNMCALIINVVAGDVDDGVTTIDGLKKNTALKLLESSFNFSCDNSISAESHIQNLDFFNSMLKQLCSESPEKIPSVFPECVNLWAEENLDREMKQKNKQLTTGVTSDDKK